MGLIYCFRYSGHRKSDKIIRHLRKKIWKPLQTMLISEGKVFEVESSKDKGLRCVCGTVTDQLWLEWNICECYP